MKEVREGRKLLRLLFGTVCMVCLMAALSGCGGTSRYQAVDLNETRSSQNEGEAADMTMISMGETEAASEGGTEAGTEIESESETEAEETYEPADEIVIVTADVLNVRESASQNARIYVQLKAGDTLRRTGYNETWSQVLYDGKTAYVASDMVEVKEEEPDAVEAGAEAEPAAATQAEGDVLEAGAKDQDAETYGLTRAAETAAEIPWNGRTVAIDAGHQAKANAEKEPIGPSSTTMKAKMPEGSVGAASGVREYELTLTVSLKLEEELKSRGYHVVMIRTGHDVNLSNAERSILANESGADILIRIHANSMENSGVYGALCMCMTAQNPYNASLHDKSYALSKKIVDNICGQTGTKNRGVQEVDNSGAINWSEIPVSVVEMGFLSNPDEDRWMQDDNYQNKIVAGISAAVDAYFAEGN